MPAIVRDRHRRVVNGLLRFGATRLSRQHPTLGLHGHLWAVAQHLWLWPGGHPSGGPGMVGVAREVWGSVRSLAFRRIWETSWG
jgi:hypothetical protein